MAGPVPRYVRDFHHHGYAVVRSVFSTAEVAELAAAFDRIWAEGLRHPRSFRHGNVLYRVGEDPAVGRVLKLMQWPSYFDPQLDRLRQDARLFAIVAPLIGRDLKQIINQLHWKPPGGAMAEFGWHQDIRFRRPRSAYREPDRCYVQTGIAVDPHRAENGAMRILPGSHRLGDLALCAGRTVDRPLDDAELIAAGLDPAEACVLELEPGDVALWHLHTLHGSGPNRTAIDRRFYLNGYVAAASCDRGEWTFRDGVPVPLGEPVLVHYEDLYLHPGPHYVD